MLRRRRVAGPLRRARRRVSATSYRTEAGGRPRPAAPARRRARCPPARAHPSRSAQRLSDGRPSAAATRPFAKSPWRLPPAAARWARPRASASTRRDAVPIQDREARPTSLVSSWGSTASQAGFAEQRSELALRAMEQDADAPLTNADRGAYLLVTGAFDVCQTDKLALFGPQRRKHARHVQPQCQVRTVGDAFGRRASFRAFAPRPPPVVDHQVARDSNQQGTLLRRIVWRPLDAQQTQVRFLDDVVGLRHAAHDTDDIRTQRARGPAIAGMKRLLIQRRGLLGRPDGSGFGKGLGCHPGLRIHDRYASPGRDVRIGPEVCRLEHAEAFAEPVGGARREKKPDAEREQNDAGDGKDVGSVVLKEA